MAFLYLSISFIFGFGLGWLFRGLRAPTSKEANRAEPLDHDDYLKSRDRLVTAYTQSLNEYDRLVTWASGGALGLSITFVEKFGANADRATGWWLGSGLTALGFAFALSLWSQYFSSRIHSWRRKELDHLQKPEEERKDSWRAEALRLDRIARIHGAVTKWFTLISGIVLVVGLGALARFAFLNAPFKP